MQRCLGCMREFGDEFDVCPHCGYLVGTEAVSKNHLAPGTVLQNRYTLGKVLGQGGFGITYIAWDAKIGRAVAVKEYMPNALASRMTGEKEIACYNDEAQRQFTLGLEKTRKETHALSRFNALESVVKVHDCIEENGTAYIIMELLRGKTVKEILSERGKLSFAETMRIMTPVLQTLDAMHSVGMIHRDVAPDNIFVCDDGKIKLLDFGAARVVNTTDEKTLSVVLKAGYAPVEQYSSKAKQGAYTDVYAASATVYKMLTGETPPDSLSREKDGSDLAALPQTDAPQSAQETILHGMATDAQSRIQSVKELLGALQKDMPETVAGIDPKDFLQEQKKKQTKKILRIVIAAALVVCIALVSAVIGLQNKKIPTSEKTEAQSYEQESDNAVETSIAKLSLSAEQLKKKLRTSVDNKEIKDFYCADYNGDGTLEAFALVIEREYEGEVIHIDTTVYFVSGESVQTVGVLSGISISGRLIKLTADGMVYGYYAHTGFETGESADVYTVDQAGAPLNASLHSRAPILFSDYGWFAGYKQAYEDRRAGRVYKEYYTFFDSKTCSFVEYAAVPITIEQLYALKGAKDALADVNKESIRSVLFRENGIINVNLEEDESEENGSGDFNIVLYFIDGKITNEYNKYDNYSESISYETRNGNILDYSVDFGAIAKYPKTLPDSDTVIYDTLDSFIQFYQSHYVGTHVAWYSDKDWQNDGDTSNPFQFEVRYLDVDGDGEEECFFAVGQNMTWDVQLFDIVDGIVYCVKEWEYLSTNDQSSQLLQVVQDEKKNIFIQQISASSFEDSSEYFDLIIMSYDGHVCTDQIRLLMKEDYSTKAKKWYAINTPDTSLILDDVLDSYQITESEFTQKKQETQKNSTVLLSYGD